MNFTDTQVIERSATGGNAMPLGEDPLTPEQEAKLEQFRALVGEVGEVSFDTEIDILIALMTEIRDR